MERNVITCLDSIPLLLIRRFANRSARFIDIYSKGLTGTQAEWATKKYRGIIPTNFLEQLNEEQQQKQQNI